jgi:hypothetical protein
MALSRLMGVEEAENSTVRHTPGKLEEGAGQGRGTQPKSPAEGRLVSPLPPTLRHNVGKIGNWAEERRHIDRRI